MSNESKASEKTDNRFAEHCTARLASALHASGHALPDWDLRAINEITSEFLEHQASHARNEALRKVQSILNCNGWQMAVKFANEFINAELAKGTV